MKRSNAGARLGERYYLDDETKAHLRDVAVANPDCTQRDLAERFGCSQPTVHYHLKLAGIKSPRAKKRREDT